MEDKMEHKIGEIISLEDSGVFLEVVEASASCHCDGCKFVICAPLCHAVKCLADYRSDHKNIIYKEIKVD